MPAANGDDARSTFAAAKICDLTKHIGAGADERTEQRAVESQNAVDNKPDTHSSKDDRTQNTWNELQGCID